MMTFKNIVMHEQPPLRGRSERCEVGKDYPLINEAIQKDLSLGRLAVCAHCEDILTEG